MIRARSGVVGPSVRWPVIVPMPAAGPVPESPNRHRHCAGAASRLAEDASATFASHGGLCYTAVEARYGPLMGQQGAENSKAYETAFPGV